MPDTILAMLVGVIAALHALHVVDHIPVGMSTSLWIGRQWRLC
jgi:hypothetical protein